MATTKRAKRAPKVEIYRSGADNQWRWHLRAANGKLLCQGEGHSVRANARRAAEGVMRAFLHIDLKIVVVE
jgi:uncharacterized protein YegP (UPF0339 family)